MIAQQRYIVRERETTELARSYGQPETMHDVWDTVKDKRVPFGMYRSRARALARIVRILEQERRVGDSG